MHSCFRLQDADLIEILWKQDVDLGIPLEDYRPVHQPVASVQQQQQQQQAPSTFPIPIAGQAKAFPTAFTTVEPQLTEQPTQQTSLSPSAHYMSPCPIDKSVKVYYCYFCSSSSSCLLMCSFVYIRLRMLDSDNDNNIFCLYFCFRFQKGYEAEVQQPHRINSETGKTSVITKSDYVIICNQIFYSI